jgi:hypothetical protein
LQPMVAIRLPGASPTLPVNEQAGNGTRDNPILRASVKSQSLLPQQMLSIKAHKVRFETGRAVVVGKGVPSRDIFSPEGLDLFRSEVGGGWGTYDRGHGYGYGSVRPYRGGVTVRNQDTYWPSVTVS